MNTIIPIEAYPPLCFTFVQSDNLVAIIERGIAGYTPVGGKDDDADNRALVAEQNASLGVKPSMAAAMVFGSMFGWDKPGADPAKYEHLDHLDFIAELETVSTELADAARQKVREGLRGSDLRAYFKRAYEDAKAARVVTGEPV